MKHQTLKVLATLIALAAILMLGACKKKAAPPPPPPPPPPPSPTASISVSPDTIQQGGSATLTWQTSNATDVSIGGIGAVQPSGSQTVNPTDSTTYHLTAKGAGGTQDATTRLTVTPPPVTQAPTPSPTDEDLFGQTIKDVTSITTSLTFVATSKPPSRPTLNSSTSIPPSTSRWKATAIPAVQLNTTWLWATSAPVR
jgi:peptidoglycan-associated lipoprotein